MDVEFENLTKAIRNYIAANGFCQHYEDIVITFSKFESEAVVTNALDIMVKTKQLINDGHNNLSVVVC